MTIASSVLFNKLRGFSAQSSLDAPRFCISAGLPDANTANSSSAGDINSEIYFEEGIDPQVVAELESQSGYELTRALLTLSCS